MRNFVIIEQGSSVAIESHYNPIDSITTRHEVENAFKHFQRGFESFDIVSKLYKIVETTKEITPGLESSIILTLDSCKEIIGDYSQTIALENYSSPEMKRSVALEGLGSFLKKIWEAIVNFFKKIWNWIFNKKSGDSSSITKSIEIKKEEDKKEDKKAEEIVKALKQPAATEEQKEEQRKMIRKLNEEKIKKTYKKNYLKIYPSKTYDDFFLDGEDLLKKLNKINLEKITNLQLIFNLLKDNQNNDVGPLELLAKEGVRLGYDLGTLKTAKIDDENKGMVPIITTASNPLCSNFMTYAYFDLRKHHSTIKDNKVDDFLHRYSLISSLGNYSISMTETGLSIEKNADLQEHALFSEYSSNQKAMEGILDRFLSISKDNALFEKEFEKEIKIFSAQAQKTLKENNDTEALESSRTKNILLKFLMSETRALSYSITRVNSLLNDYTNIYMDLKENGRFIEQLDLAKRLNIENDN